MTLPKYLDYEPKHVSYSTVNGYRSCAKRTYLEKVLRLESIPGLAAIGGNAVHSGTELVDRYILEHGFEGIESEATFALDIASNDNH